ncbi:thioesterase [Caloramator sp. E03]|uniref:thioesterase family protein n=1 Tax=Caloramator sp. E03 TaxID=2576307 RepID=UPI0011106AC0|nr:thioesterase family protein [Caloramator sp. E03]QCX34826.1 thioesterase [Caloramator sp. E03]
MEKIKVGLNSSIETDVKSEHSASKYGSGMVDVLATPAMIALMECTAKNAVDLHLPVGYTTVGTKVDVVHIAATPIGMKITVNAKLIEIKGKKLIFRVEAFDEVEKIGEGIHERYVINSDKFMEKVNSKKK